MGLGGMGKMAGMKCGMMGMNSVNGMMPSLNFGLLGQNLAMQRAMTMMRTVGARAGMPGMGMGMPAMGGFPAMSRSKNSSATSSLGSLLA